MRALAGFLLLLGSMAQFPAFANAADTPTVDPATSALAPFYDEASCPVEASVASPEDFFPPGSIRRVESGEVIIEFTVNFGSSRTRDVVLVQGSGFEDLDRAALKLGRALAVTAHCGSQRVRRSIVFDAYRDPRDKPERHGCLVFDYVIPTVSIFPVEVE